MNPLPAFPERFAPHPKTCVMRQSKRLPLAMYRFTASGTMSATLG
jgi:hypothetical protein